MKKLIVATVSFYDLDRRLWRTDIGFENKEGALYCSVWGNTKSKSIMRAKGLANLLNKALSQFGKAIAN